MPVHSPVHSSQQWSEQKLWQQSTQTTPHRPGREVADLGCAHVASGAQLHAAARQRLSAGAQQGHRLRGSQAWGP